MPTTAPRRILFLNQSFLPDPLATSQYLAGWAAELVREGNEVTILAGRRAYHDPSRKYPREEQWKGVRVVRAGSTGWGKSASWRRALDFGSFLLAAFGRGVRLPRQDVIVALTSPPLISVVAALLSLLFRARFIYWVMDLNPDAAIAGGWLGKRSIVAWGLEILSRWSLGQAAQVIALDPYIKERLMAKGIPRDRIEVIPLWIQPEVRFDDLGREAVRCAHGWQDKLVVMVAGNHGPCHPLETLLAAAAELEFESRLHFCFVGGGAEWPRLQARAERSANFTLIDYVSPAELAATLSAADVQVVIMGVPFVGMIHPCKIYNLLAVKRPLIYIGPVSGPIPELMAEAGLGEAAASFRHGDQHGLACYLGACLKNGPIAWPETVRTRRWRESVVLEKMSSTLPTRGR